jgi:uncharacterized membrane protein YesL
MENTRDKRVKTTFFRFFEAWTQRFWMLVPINFLYSIFSFFILPAGLAQAGMTYVTRNLARDTHSFGISDFWDTIKSNWKRALCIGLLNTLVSFLLIFGILFYYNSEGLIADLGLGFLVLCFVLFSFMQFYIWFLVVTFRLSVTKIYKNAFLLSVVGIGRNLFAGVLILTVYAALVFLVILFRHFIALFLAGIVATFILPGFQHLLIQFTIFPVVQKYMIDPYYEAHPDEDISLRRNLSLDTKEQPGEKQEPVFHD